MNRRPHLLRPAVVGALCPLVLGLGPAAPARAEPAFVAADTALSYAVTLEVAGTGCGAGGSTMGAPPALVENGGVVTTHNDVTLTGNHTTPVSTGTFAGDGRASLTSAGGLPRTMDVSASGQGQVTFTDTSFGCTSGGGIRYPLYFRFLLPTPVYLDVTATISGRGQGELDLSSSGGGPAVSGGTVGFPGSGTTRILLPPGDYSGQLMAAASIRTNVTASGGGSAAMHAVFTPLGAQLAAPSGAAAARYVTLPASASCGSGTVTAQLTTKKKLLRRVRSVSFVLGTTRTRIGRPKKGELVPTAFAGHQPGTLKASITLRPKHRGARPKVLTIQATYEACS